MLPVNECFQTIQGEATHTGTPAVFVRLQGCGVGCGFCDTKHTWARDPADVVGVDAMLAKVADAPTHAMLSAAQIVGTVATRFRARHVVITGGEPCQYDLTDLCDRFENAGYRVQIETSGTQPIRTTHDAWVTVSPKVGMPGGYKVLSTAVGRADEIKWPVGKATDVEALQAFLAAFPFATLGAIWLQPLSRNPKATALCVEAATEHGWRVSIQTHQLIGVR